MVDFFALRKPERFRDGYWGLGALMPTRHFHVSPCFT